MGRQAKQVYIELPRTKAQVLGHYDVVVVGGGPAGCSAAVTAARLGADVLLVERVGALGGAPVTQGVAVILSTNGVDFQGIWNEWARLLKERGGIAEMIRAPSHYHPELSWFRSSVDAEMGKWVWDSLLERAGCSVLLQAQAVSVTVEDGAVTGVVVETRAGRALVRARVVVDATGDGVVSAEAGAPWTRGGIEKAWPQQVSLTYLIGWYGEAPGVRAGEVREGVPGSVGNKPHRRSRSNLKQVDPLDPWDVTRAIRALQREVWQSTVDLPDGEYLVDTPLDLGVRTSRIITGRSTVTEDEAWEYRKHPESIARSSWELDVHPPDDGPVPERYYHSGSEAYKRRNERTAAGEFFDIPYGCLVPEGVEHLLVAGRLVSSELLAQGSLRIQQTCMATGQAAGVAAALSVRSNLPPSAVPVGQVQDILSRQREVEPAFSCLKDIPVAGR